MGTFISQKEKVSCDFCNKVIFDSYTRTEANYTQVQIHKGEKYMNKCDECDIYDTSFKEIFTRAITGTLKRKICTPNHEIRIKILGISHPVEYRDNSFSINLDSDSN